MIDILIQRYDRQLLIYFGGVRSILAKNEVNIASKIVPGALKGAGSIVMWHEF